MGRVFKPKYKDRKTGEWKEVRVWWLEYSSDGRQYRESSRSRKRRVAVDKLKQRLGEIGKREFVGPQADKTTFEDLADLLLTEYRARGRRSIGRIEDAVNHLRGFFGHLRAHAITTDRIEHYIEDRKKERPGNIKNPTSTKTTAVATINRELAALRRMFRLGLRGGKITRMPYISLLPEHNVRTGFFEPDQYTALRAELPAYVQPVTDFLYLTGWRAGEALGLTWTQVDFAAGIVRLEPGTTKNNEGRTFPFTALPALADLLGRLRKQTEALQRAQGRIIPWVFHREGEPITSFRNAWLGACKRAGLVGRVIHDFRRTGVRNLERAGVPRSVAMKLVGHKTESVYRRYSVTSEGDLREGVAKLAALHHAQAQAPRTFVPLAAAAGRTPRTGSRKVSAKSAGAGPQRGVR